MLNQTEIKMVSVYSNDNDGTLMIMMLITVIIRITTVMRIFSSKFKHFLKGALSGLRRLLATESRLKIRKNAFNFTSKVLFVLKIFKFLS